MDADGGNVRRLTHNDRHDESPTWSPGGRYIAFAGMAAGSDGAEPTLQIFSITADGSEETQLTFLPGHNSAPRWSPDGTMILFYGQAREDADDVDIFTMSPDGPDLTNLTNDREPDWSPSMFLAGLRSSLRGGRGIPSTSG